MTLNAQFTFTKNVATPPTATAKVTFYDGVPNGANQIGAVVDLVNINVAQGTASASLTGITNLAVGGHTIYAVYATDTSFIGAQATTVNTASQTVNRGAFLLF